MGATADAQLDQNQKRRRICILGAGFSHEAGLPLARDLWPEVLRRASRIPGRAEKFLVDLDAYIEYRKACYNETLTRDGVDFEDFLAFLDIEHYLGLRGRHTWSDDGNEGQVVVKTLIGEILTEKTPLPDKVPELYRRFAAGLRPDDLVLTFNYDVLLERALDSVGKPYRMFPQRLRNVTKSVGVPDWDIAEDDPLGEEVVILKMHGSIDWFERPENIVGLDPVFDNAESLGVVPLLDGSQLPDDPLRNMCRVRKIEKLYRPRILFMSTPWLLNPSSMKILYARKLADFWSWLEHKGEYNYDLAIIGFSLPHHDEYARQMLYRLVKNYQTTNWNEDVYGKKKTPLILIDRRQSEEEREKLKKAYAFVDWTKTETRLNGFDEDALDLLFNNSSA
jgi:hypothetical protein